MQSPGFQEIPLRDSSKLEPRHNKKKATEMKMGLKVREGGKSCQTEPPKYYPFLVLDHLATRMYHDHLRRVKRTAKRMTSRVGLSSFLRMQT